MLRSPLSPNAGLLLEYFDHHSFCFPLASFWNHAPKGLSSKFFLSFRVVSHFQLDTCTDFDERLKIRSAIRILRKPADAKQDERNKAVTTSVHLQDRRAVFQVKCNLFTLKCEEVWLLCAEKDEYLI